MAIQPMAAIRPAHLKLGLYGDTGSGKTFTAAKMLTGFIRQHCPKKRLAMFDTEPSAGYVADMIREAIGTDLIVVQSRSYPDLMEFCDFVKKEGHVAWLDSATHPWESLKSDYLDAKKSRVKGAGGNPDTTKMTMADWQVVLPLWGRFTERFCYDPIHWCICGRETVATTTELDEDNTERLKVTGDRMKTQKDTGYEPSLLLQMMLDHDRHVAIVKKDRFDSYRVLTRSEANPGYEFIAPHVGLLDIGGKGVTRPEDNPAFTKGSGPNWETIQARRAAVLEDIKDDLVLAYPGQTADSKRAKINLLRGVFNTSSWSSLEKDHAKYPLDVLEEGRANLRTLITEEG